MSIIEMIIGALAMLGVGTVLVVVITSCCVFSGIKKRFRGFETPLWEDKEEDDD